MTRTIIHAITAVLETISSARKLATFVCVLALDPLEARNLSKIDIALHFILKLHKKDLQFQWHGDMDGMREGGLHPHLLKDGPRDSLKAEERLWGTGWA